jgi:hypothetical protein
LLWGLFEGPLFWTRNIHIHRALIKDGLMFAHLAKKFPTFYGIRFSLPCSQERSSRSYPYLLESAPCSPCLFPKSVLTLFLPLGSRSPTWSFLWRGSTNMFCAFLRYCLILSNTMRPYGEGNLASRPIRKLDDYILSTSRDWLFNILIVNIHIWGASPP